jgi:uncharacterized protein
VEQRVSLITLGVTDLVRARGFYEALGWKTNADEDDDVVFFQAGGLVVALWDRRKLAADSGVAENGEGFGGVTLAYIVRGPEQVDAVLKEAKAAGATITRDAGTTFWGGYSGVFVDPDGYPWEVAHNPHWTLHDDGSVSLGK